MITQKELDTERFIMMATKDGTIKKTPASEYRNVRKNGLLAITLKENDELISVKDTAGDEQVLLVSRNGMTIRFNETDVRICGRTSIGVRGIKLADNDELVSMEISTPEKTVLFVSENGLGKRTRFEDFNEQGRGGKGSRGYKITEKTGSLIGTESVAGDEEIMIITTEGIVIRTKIDSIPVLGKTTSGVKLINISKDSESRVASFTIVTSSEEENNEDHAEVSEEVSEADIVEAAEEVTAENTETEI